jgi:hypothetical protein
MQNYFLMQNIFYIFDNVLFAFINYNSQSSHVYMPSADYAKKLLKKPEFYATILVFLKIEQ